MKEYKDEPKVGPTEKKQAGKLNFDHDMLHDSDSMAPGHRVKLIVHGHVTSNRGKDEYGPGNVQMDIHSVEHHPEQDGVQKPSKKNASTVRLDDLKKHIEKLTERETNSETKTDRDMEGHVEDGIKEKGKDE